MRTGWRHAPRVSWGRLRMSQPGLGASPAHLIGGRMKLDKLANSLAGRRVVAVHAHTDDEAIATGGALARLSARGADVTVITCTLGEQGEVIGKTYQQLVNGDADQLGGFRIHELLASLEVLGVSGRLLGGAGRWRDS